MHCENSIWTVESLCGLLKGVPVDRFYQVKNEIYQGLISDFEELKKVVEAGKLLDEFYAYVQDKEGMSLVISPLSQPEITEKKRKTKKRNSSKNKSKNKLHFQQRDLFSCENEFLKWVAQGKIHIDEEFVPSLPKDLRNMYEDATPISIILRTKSRLSREYHRALYLNHALELIKSSLNPLSREDIYENEKMKNLLRSFRNAKGKHANYKKKTVMYSWLPIIDKRARGRPKTQSA